MSYQMNQTYASLDPVPVSRITEHSAAENRTFQGIPSIEISTSGRIFGVWYGGGTTECRENYIMLFCSDDGGITWCDEAVAVVDPPHPDVRTFDPAIWRAPDGRIYLFWAQGCAGKDGTWKTHDGIQGVWFSILENPDSDPEGFKFTAPRRICNGIMLNKPTVLRDGSWFLPCSLWGFLPSPADHSSLGVVTGTFFMVSQDNGNHFEQRGLIDMQEIEGGADCDEPMLIELNNGTLRCYLRCKAGIAVSESSDNGFTWSKPEMSHSLTGPFSRIFIRRLQSGRLLCVMNDSPVKKERVDMTAFLSEDDGTTWKYKLLLDPGFDTAYPDGFETVNGDIFVTYDQDRDKGGFIYLAKFTEADVIAGSIVSKQSFLRHEISRSKPVPGK